MQLLGAAVEKHSTFQQDFQRHEEYTLLYSDRRPVETIPGTSNPFQLEEYRTACGKTFSKLLFYIVAENGNLSVPTADNIYTCRPTVSIIFTFSYTSTAF